MAYSPLLVVLAQPLLMLACTILLSTSICLHQSPPIPTILRVTDLLATRMLGKWGPAARYMARISAYSRSLADVDALLVHERCCNFDEEGEWTCYWKLWNVGCALVWSFVG